jgi:hypothetical protein
MKITYISRDNAIEQLATNQLNKCLSDYSIHEDTSVLHSFITGESKAYNLLTNEQLETEYFEDFNIEVTIK